MNSIIVVFRSRSDTLKFNNELMKMRIQGQIINTPREAGKTCGISIKISEQAYQIAQRLLIIASYPSFAGFYAEIGNVYRKL